MGLLTYAYDPVGTASVLARAAEVGSQKSAQQQQMLLELAKSLADNRRHDIEFNRRQSFEVAKELEERRRWNIENAPIGAATPTSPPSRAATLTVPPADSSPSAGLDPTATGIPAMDAPAAPDTPAGPTALSIPATMDSPYTVDSSGLSTSGPFTDSGAPAVDPMSLPSAVPASPAASASDAVAPVGPVDAEAAGAQQIADTTMPGPHGQLVPRVAPNVALQTRAGRAATRTLPLDPGALPTNSSPAESAASALLDPMATAQNEMAARGVPRKIAAPHLAQLASQLALRDSAPEKTPTKLPDGSYVIGGKQYVKQPDGSFTTSTTANSAQNVEDYQQAKGWTKDVDPASPTFGALQDKDGAAHWVHVGGNGKIVDMPARPPVAKIGFDEKKQAAELGYVAKNGAWYDPETKMYHRAGQNGFLGVSPSEAQILEGGAGGKAVKPTTAEQIWATEHANSVDRLNVVKPLLDKAGLGLGATYDDMKPAIKAGTLTDAQANFANYWLGQFRDRVGVKAKDDPAKAAELNKAFAEQTAKLSVLKAKGVTVTPIDPKELRDAMLVEGATSPDPKARIAAVTALDKQGDMVTVVSPSGQKGKIPRAKLDDALAAGYKAQ